MTFWSPSYISGQLQQNGSGFEGRLNMYKMLNIKNWERKDQFSFFKDFDNPFFNICTEVDVTELHAFAEAEELSFFITSLYASLKTANIVEEFRYRIRDNGVIIYDEIHAGSTVLNEDDTFSFCFFPFKTSFDEFNIEAKQLLQDISLQKEILNPRTNQDNLIHYSVIPWISFFSISHARKFRTNDSIPKIVFGKFNKKDNRLKMPISIEVHHSLIDGVHVSKYLNKFQEILDEPKRYL
ncbi:CatA-like O-acetyltransferase [candidate division CSSED10-310 bacterium]|uniref:CatA-like O-acetyltransferase n=1 Tax=candidate division CSSED10-310 bacterium TaxID=2855610 RepID=A0ABV6YUN9_UNCC1